MQHLIEMPRIMSKVLNVIQPQIEALSRDLSRFRMCFISAGAPASRWRWKVL